MSFKSFIYAIWKWKEQFDQDCPRRDLNRGPVGPMSSVPANSATLSPLINFFARACRWLALATMWFWNCNITTKWNCVFYILENTWNVVLGNGIVVILWLIVGWKLRKCSKKVWAFDSWLAELVFLVLHTPVKNRYNELKKQHASYTQKHHYQQ